MDPRSRVEGARATRGFAGAIRVATRAGGGARRGPARCAPEGQRRTLLGAGRASHETVPDWLKGASEGPLESRAARRRRARMRLSRKTRRSTQRIEMPAGRGSRPSAAKSRRWSSFALCGAIIFTLRWGRTSTFTWYRPALKRVLASVSRPFIPLTLRDSRSFYRPPKKTSASSRPSASSSRRSTKRDAIRRTVRRPCYAAADYPREKLEVIVPSTTARPTAPWRELDARHAALAGARLREVSPRNKGKGREANGRPARGAPERATFCSTSIPIASSVATASAADCPGLR